MLHDLNIYVVGRLFLAALLGGMVGFERELSHKPAGIRTNMLICLGAALFTVISYEMAGNVGGDHTRIAAQIIPGIGFIGAGVVIRERGTIIGITSAATIFVVASIGTAVGAGLYVTGTFTAFMLLASLVIIGHLEQRFGLHEQFMNFRVTLADPQNANDRVRAVVDDVGAHVQRWSAHELNGQTVIDFDADITEPQEKQLINRLSALPAKCEARPRRAVTAL